MVFLTILRSRRPFVTVITDVNVVSQEGTPFSWNCTNEEGYMDEFAHERVVHRDFIIEY
jgi:hypothetical protein